jgi:hypothetical protein
MAGKPWVNDVKHVIDGERVDAQITGRPSRALEQQTAYLKARLEALEAGEGTYLYEVTCEADALVGQPVYFNTETQRFERGLAALDTDSDGALIPADSCNVIGVVWYKQNSTKCDVLIYGKGQVSLSNAVDGDLVPGHYYLSGREAGKLTLQKPGVTVPVLVATGTDDIVYAHPQLRDLAESHVHHRFELYLQPAGTTVPPDPSGRHVISVADPGDPGWLPADHETFGGLAPKLAAFGYNLDQHPELARIWPPLPGDAVAVTLFKETDGNGVELPTGLDGLVAIDRNGIWWMSDCYGDVPWEVEFNNSSSSAVSSASHTSQTAPECPRTKQRKLVLSFARVRYATDKSVVTSLDSSDPDGPIKIVNCDNKPARTGALVIKYDASAAIEKNDQEGSLVFKEFGETGKVKRGRVIEGVRSTTGRIAIAGSAAKIISGKTYAQGLVELTFDAEPESRVLNPQVVRVDDAKDRYYKDVMYLGLPPDQASGLRYKFKLPGTDALPASPEVKLRVMLFARLAGTLPALLLTYRRIPRPVSDDPLPTTETSLTINTAVSVDQDDYVEVESDTISGVAEGDLILFSLTREDGDGYAGEVGVLDAVAVLVPG